VLSYTSAPHRSAAESIATGDRSAATWGARFALTLARPVPFARVVRYRLIDLFAGCGGMTRGFVDSGRFTPTFAVECEPRAADTYAANFPTANLEKRPIERVDIFPEADVVIGGPPCQGFSTLNRDGAELASRRLWQEYLRGLMTSQPRVFVMENVPQILDSQEYEEFAAAIDADGVYQLDERVLNVADYGVAQRRRRAFVVGTTLGGFPWPTQTHADPGLGDARYLPWKTFDQAMKGLPRKPNGKNWHRDRNPRPMSLTRYRAVPAGGNRFDMERVLDEQGLGELVPPCWRKHRTGSHDVFGRLWGDRPATTIRTEFFKPEKGRYLHPTEHRAITVREAARLMSFPDHHALPEDQSMTAISRQLGNAVPPLMAQRMADAIAIALDTNLAVEPVLQLVA
jgi:DNA (cytosine-5)-methyltransferase 1